MKNVKGVTYNINYHSTMQVPPALGSFLASFHCFGFAAHNFTVLVHCPWSACSRQLMNSDKPTVLYLFSTKFQVDKISG